jgi:hypothetical protein
MIARAKEGTVIRNRLVYATALLVTLALSQRAHAGAEIQKAGAEVYPGRFAVGISPLGVQAAFDDRSTGGYKLQADFAAQIKEFEKLSLWIGGLLGYTHPSYSCGNFGGCAQDIILGVFARLTFEKLVTKIPLVPFAEAGVDIHILAFRDSNVGGGAALRLGGGVYYYLLKFLGLGVQTDFAFGGASYPVAATRTCNPGNSTCGGFLGNWDFLIGARFHF